MANPTQTAVVDYNSDLVRKSWVREGLIQKASESLFAPYMGNSPDAVVYQVNDTNASEGHTVVFDFDGNIAGRAIKGKDAATGKGIQKKKFSDKIVVERYRMVVNNGDAFDGVNIGDLSITQHADSRSKLADQYIRFKDQALIDALQGNLGQAPSHIIDLDTTNNGNFDIDALSQIETALKTGTGFTTGDTRRPPKPFKTIDGRKIWLFFVDAFMAAKLKASDGYQSLVYNADVRGNQNRAISGIIGKLGQLIIVEMPNFMGETAGSTNPWGLDDSSIEIAGFRQYDKTTGAWTGQEGFSFGDDLKLRGVVVGAGAAQLAMGKMPDYKYQSYDFDINSESALEVWTNVQKTRLLAENEDYAMAKVAGIDFGVVAVDVSK